MKKVMSFIINNGFTDNQDFWVTFAMEGNISYVTSYSPTEAQEDPQEWEFEDIDRALEIFNQERERLYNRYML